LIKDSFLVTDGSGELWQRYATVIGKFHSKSHIFPEKYLPVTHLAKPEIFTFFLRSQIFQVRSQTFYEDE